MESIERAEALLPEWIRWGGPLGLWLFLVGVGGILLAGHRPRREEHGLAAGVQARFTGLLIGASLGFIGVVGGDFGWMVPRLVPTLLALATVYAAFDLGEARRRHIGVSVLWRSRMADWLGALPLGMTVLGAGWLPATEGWLLCVLGPVAQLLWMADAGVTTHRIVGLLRPPSKELTVLERPEAEAWAAVLTGRIVVTRRLMEVLDEAGSAAVVAHERAHLKEPLWTAWIRGSVTGMVSLLLVAWKLGGPLHWLLAGLSALGFGLWRRWVLVQNEVSADAASPPALAAALAQLHDTNELPPPASRGERAQAPSPRLSMSAVGLMVAAVLGLGACAGDVWLGFLVGTDHPLMVLRLAREYPYTEGVLLTDAAFSLSDSSGWNLWPAQGFDPPPP